MSNEKEKNPLIGAFRRLLPEHRPLPHQPDPAKEAKTGHSSTQPAKAAGRPQRKKPAEPGQGRSGARMASRCCTCLLPVNPDESEEVPPSLSKTIKQPRMASPLCRRSHLQQI